MRGLWTWLIGTIAVLLVAVLGLDQWQVQQGEASLFGLGFAGRGPERLPAPARRRPTLAGGGAQSRVAVIVDDLGARRDVFEALRNLDRPLTVAVLPALPLSSAIAAEAARAGMEVLVDLPMEPYRFPEVDPGPGALTMVMSTEELAQLDRRHLAAIPSAAGAMNHMGSRMTENRERMRAALEPLRARRLFFVDALTSNHSVAYDEAKRVGLRAGRRHLLVDHAAGEGGDRRAWDAVGRLAAERGEVIALAHGHPLTARLLKQYIPRWEAGGARLVPVSHLTR
jgi:polysaccharide deacetylase 2 family uncharacterized protein YibQ